MSSKRLAHNSFNRVVEVSAGVDIFASTRQVWGLIRPAENAVLIEPATVRAFRVPGSPVGVGELQGFIVRQDGRERLAMNEVMEEIVERYSLVRGVGTDDDSLRQAFILRESGSGTHLETRLTFTIPAELSERTESLVEETRYRLHQQLHRTKRLVEDGIHATYA